MMGTSKSYLEKCLQSTAHKYDDEVLLQKEYEDLEQVPPAPGKPWVQHDTMVKKKLCQHARANEMKNRYCNLYPFDKHIFQFEDKASYVNASWIDFGEEKRYIITMAPIHPSSYKDSDKIENTCADFWEMCWQSKGKIIVMLCSVAPGFSGCSQYFPENKSSVTFGSLTVIHEQDVTREKGNFIERKFTIAKDSETREIYHLHFVSWPNYGVPEPKLLQKFLLHVQNRATEINRESSSSPFLIVHCSGGVGRSGAFLASFVTYSKLSYLVQNSSSGGLTNSTEDIISVKDLVLTMRTQRHPWMVEGLHQYKLVYDVILLQLKSLLKEI